MKGSDIDISLIIPLYNESESVSDLVKELNWKLSKTSFKIEYVFIDDGSTDDTLNILKASSEILENYKICEHSENQGQGFAIHTGIQNSSGRNLCFIDGDLQFDPSDIVRLYSYMKVDHVEFICGWRENRRDSFVFNNLPSKLGNMLISATFNTDLKDIGCALKIVRREYVLKLKPFKNYHRYLSIFFVKMGLSFMEVSVNHRPRRFGVTKYSWTKFIGVIQEVLWIKYRYLKTLKPLEKSIKLIKKT